MNQQLEAILLEGWASEQTPQETRDEARRQGFNIDGLDVLTFWKREDEKVEAIFTKLDQHIELVRSVL